MPSDATTTDLIDLETIQRMIPHRYPFLLIDRVENSIKNTSAIGIKNVTINEPFFQGHFPAQPVMPGVLIVEAMAQTAAVLVVDTLGMIDKELLVYFMTVDNCKFRQLVKPGDRLELHVRIERGRGKLWQFHGEAKVDDTLVAEAQFKAMMVPPEDREKYS